MTGGTDHTIVTVRLSPHACLPVPHALQVMEKINNPHYLYRMTVLLTVSFLAPVLGPETTCSTMLPVVINAAKDRYEAERPPSSPSQICTTCSMSVLPTAKCEFLLSLCC